jgi:hypothetical protein
MDAATRRQVRERAGDRCEYCRLAQEEAPFVGFQMEHIIPRTHGGSDDLDNLALACYHCNQNKGPNLSGIDPKSSQIVPLFHPRRQQWERHFVMDGVLIVGRTPTGRATVVVLMMNAANRVELRRELQR